MQRLGGMLFYIHKSGERARVSRVDTGHCFCRDALSRLSLPPTSILYAIHVCLENFLSNGALLFSV